MSNTTFAQLPGLQKAAKILELQEQINQHHRFATWLLKEFNQVFSDEQAYAQPGMIIPSEFERNRANQFQIMSEWHGTQAMYLQIQLDDLKRTS
jgi:hypothetical protein